MREVGLTPDVTYRGLPLSRAAYAASLWILDRLAHGPLCALGVVTRGECYADAWIALALAGVFGPSREPSAGAFSWTEMTLTPYGRIYAEQRTWTDDGQ